MVRERLKIAIYSGEIPSTTFIERLIEGLTYKGQTIYLFGSKTKQVVYDENVRVIAYTHHRIKKLIHLLKYSVLLSVFRRKDKQKLDLLLKKQSKNLIYSKVKCYPVLWFQPDVFHVQWAKGLDEWVWVQEFGMKLIVSLRGAHINYSPIANPDLAAMYKKNFPNVDGFHAVSKAIANKAIGYGASSNKIRVVYSGLPMDLFKVGEKQKSKYFNIISVGRAHWIKGYIYAIDCFKILKDQGFKFKYTIVGDADEIELIYQIHELGLQEDIELIGSISIERVKDLVKSSDLLLLPSVEEGIANVVLEAMALKTLVLSSDCGGMEEVISNKKNGFIVPIRNSKRMAEAILDIYQIPLNNKTKVAEEALETLKSQHTEQQMIEDMLSLYHFALQK